FSQPRHQCLLVVYLVTHLRMPPRRTLRSNANRTRRPSLKLVNCFPPQEGHSSLASSMERSARRPFFPVLPRRLAWFFLISLLLRMKPCPAGSRSTPVR